MIVDSHCHLNFPQFDGQLENVFKNAFDHGVTHFLTVNTCLKEYPVLQKITQNYPFVYCSAGVHPHDAKDYTDPYFELIAALQDEKTIAVGETGLDYYYNNSPKEDQKRSFIAHIEASKATKKPLIIHTRDADQDTKDILCVDKGKISGVFHCFSGDLDLAKFALDLGFYVSFSGIITFKKAQTLLDVVQYVPLDRMLVETDSPFLTPIPHRGKPNEPAFTKYVVEKVAEVKNIASEDVARQTTRNFQDLFKVSFA